MRFLLCNNHCLNDPTAGMTRSLLTIMRWLEAAGHECCVLTTSRVEPGSAWRWKSGGFNGCLMVTTHHDEARPDLAESARYLTNATEMMDRRRPDVVIACNGHPMIGAVLTEAKRRDITTVLAVRGYGYDHPGYFRDVDHVLTTSRYLSDYYARHIGLQSTPLESPIDSAETLAPDTPRDCVTFVNPAQHKGLHLFARLADELCARRPDIPLLVVESCAIRPLPGVERMPPCDHPREYLARTRVLLVPSVWDEPFGRVAAEAMINGIPPIVSERGALPETVGGDRVHGARVVPAPVWMTPRSTHLPTACDVSQWFEAVCELWDDTVLYASMSARARAYARVTFSDADSRRRHVEYFTSLPAPVTA